MGAEFVILSLVPILIGAAAAVACALPGNFLILRRQALLGDAISHVVLPGIVAAFLVTGTVRTLPMILGAGAAALILLAGAVAATQYGPVAAEIESWTATASSSPSESRPGGSGATSESPPRSPAAGPPFEAVGPTSDPADADRPTPLDGQDANRGAIEPAIVTLSFRSQPAGAEVWRDGSEARTGVTPFEVRVPQSAEPVIFEFRRRGFETLRQEVSLAADTETAVTLSRRRRRSRHRGEATRASDSADDDPGRRGVISL